MTFTALDIDHRSDSTVIMFELRAIQSILAAVSFSLCHTNTLSLSFISACNKPYERACTFIWRLPREPDVRQFAAGHPVWQVWKCFCRR